MPTSKKRLNISLSKDLEKSLKHLANRDDEPQATKAVQLIKLAIEIDEDAVFDRLAQKRDNKNSKFISHNDAWS